MSETALRDMTKEELQEFLDAIEGHASPGGDVDYSFLMGWLEERGIASRI